MYRVVCRGMWRVMKRALVMLLLVGLTACASTISARVTSYQQWPADAAGATYHIAAPSGQDSTLEFQAFADMLRASIGPTGLVEASDKQSARFIVHIDYGSARTQSWEQRYNDPFMDGWAFNPFFGGLYGPGWGWHSGVMFGPSVVNVPVQVHKNSLTVSINDEANEGRQVYKSTAVNISDADNLPSVMPYLAQAVFDGFPGNNGQVREVNYDRR